MADHISNVNGQDEFVFTGSRDAIWHRKGQELAIGQSIETWASMPGFAHTLERAPVQFCAGDYNIGMMSDKHVVFRSDTKEAMSVVSKDYKIVQPREVLESFRMAIEEAGFQLSAGGTLFGGRRMWVTAEVADDQYIMGNDVVRRYYLIVTSCDGSLATIGKPVDTRGVCHNTITAGLKEGAQAVKISHRSVYDPKKLHVQMGLARDGFSDFIRSAKKLAAQKVDQVKAQQFIESLLFVPNVEVEKQSTQITNKVSAILSLYNGKGMGSTMDSAQGTAWGLVNAVTEYIDHHAPVRGKDAQDNRFDSSMFGKGDSTKSEAFERALALI